ncbi:hypothetical protein [Streptomyces malaysiensis]|uniref:hypothetical protein n=1 Tax=Streptomyces malaysiensis TaxID=92644 RepID=UPI0018D522FF|nr:MULTISPECIES: hypothetical protein [unclassified Streptomyces]
MPARTPGGVGHPRPGPARQARPGPAAQYTGGRGGRLRTGRRTPPFTAAGLPEGEEKAAVLRACLKRWGWEVGAFFDGVTAASSDAELSRIAPMHPVFRITEGDA